MIRKITYPKPSAGKYQAILPQQYKSRTYLLACFYCFCALSSFLNLACGGNAADTSSSTKNNEPVTLKSERTTISAKDYQNNIHCDALANRSDELEASILRQEQAAKQALSQAKEACRGDSAVDCGFWTERASGLTRQARELRRQQQKLASEKAQKGCN
jgi:hypothetical protein